MSIDLGSPPATDDPATFSWWQQDLRRAPLPADCPALAGRVTADVVIVGGGYTGMWTALTLQERAPHLSIVLLDSGRCGDGASSRAAGNVHGYWSAIPTLSQHLGPDRAIEVARLGSLAQDRIRAFATASRRDVWWREHGYLRVSASRAQDAKVQLYAHVAEQLGLADVVRILTPKETALHCASPLFRGGVRFSEGATVNPALLAAALRQAVREAGVRIFERTAAVGIDQGQSSRVRTRNGEVIACEVVLANYTGTLALSQVHARTTIFSSFPVMSNPAPEELDALNWRVSQGIADLRMFQHYFRRTIDGRVLMGSGSGRMAFGANDRDVSQRFDRASTERAEAGLRRLLPSIHAAGIAAKWGWPIEVSSDRLPFFGTLSGARTHFGSGYSGHGINATCIAGHCLASLVLREKDRWSLSPFCVREQPRLPFEPFRYVGGRAIQWGVLSCEDAEDNGVVASWPARFVSTLPQRFGLRIGTR